MNFRQASLVDAAVLARMNRQLIQDEGHRNLMNEAQLAQRMMGWLQSEYEAVVFMLAGVDVGYALYRREPEYVYLRQFWVDRMYRGRGIGRFALQWLQQNPWRKAKQIRLEVLLGNERAIAFWRAVGFIDYALTMEMKNDTK